MSPFKQSGLTCRKHSNLGTNLAVTTPPEIIEIMMLEKKIERRKAAAINTEAAWMDGGVGSGREDS